MTRVVEAGAPKTSSHSKLTTPLFLNLQKRIARHAAAAKSLQLNPSTPAAVAPGAQDIFFASKHCLLVPLPEHFAAYLHFQGIRPPA